MAAAPVQAGHGLGPRTVHPSAASPLPRVADPFERAVWAAGDEDGYHLYIAKGSEYWAWRPVATIQPGGEDQEPWIGYHCLTGNGRHVVAVVAPRSAANHPLARDRGGTAYSVEVATGRVKPLAAGVAVKYHTPGCGSGSRATLSRSLGRDQASTEILLVGADTGGILKTLSVRGQVTSAVPVGNSVWAARGRDIVRLDGRERRLRHTGGLPYALRPASRGVDYLVARAGRRVTIERVRVDRVHRRLGAGRLGTQLFLGARGRNTVVGAARVIRGARLRRGRAPRNGIVRSASLGGRLVLSEPRRRAVAAGRQEAPGTFDNGVGQGSPLISAARGPRGVRSYLGPARVQAFTRTPQLAESGRPKARATNYTTPKCAVPRNHLRRQVPQPTAPQINWAIQQATRNLLSGSVLTRPADFLNMQLSSYQPSNDFTRRALVGGTASTPVPPTLIAAVYAQESAWRQASFRALPGVSGNPLVGDYYGASGTLDRIDYTQADCGYGVSQVTDPMGASSTQYSANGKTKVAVDYAENVAAGIQFLVDKWNVLATNGVTLNGGDPRYLENWYFAVWAYNSGFYSPGSGPWGLGWTNNPQNADYPPDRQPFLRATYADAEHPADWPYQERIFGWMETPLVDYRGQPAYQTGGIIDPPGRFRFCTASNECSPSYRDPTGSGKDFCMRADRKCWWHESVAYKTCPNECHEGIFDVSTSAAEPSPANNYAPACNSGLDGDTIVVDEQPTNLNVEGCSGVNWSSQGSFSASHGQAASGAPLGVIDWHQLGTGFGGHVWFTKNQPAGDTAHLNTGTWTPPSLNGLYNVKAHIPPSGASTSYATYRIHRGDGSVAERTINQHLHENRWVSLGNFTLQAGAKVVLDNVTGEGDETASVAFDAVAFTPVQGTVQRRVFDATTTFDENQRIDSEQPAPIRWFTEPLDTMANIYEWSNGLTSSVTSLPACPGSQSSGCVAAGTRSAYSEWRSRVLAAGGSHQTPQPSDTQPGWLSYANPDPPDPLPTGWLGNQSNYKVRSRLDVEFLKSGNQIDPSSVTVLHEARAGDTHMPSFILPIMRALRDDYGVAMPDLSYSAVDLNSYTHATSSVDPSTNGITPGRAFRWRVSEPAPTDGGECVRIKAVSGGTIGLKPMVKNTAVAASVEAWRQRVRDLVSSGRAPQALANGADDIYESFFSQAGAPDTNAPFHFAAPIWIQQDARFCADGRVLPGTDRVAESGYMPDLYLFVDGRGIDLQGQLRSGPAQTGDFKRFTNPPTSYNPLYDRNPWSPCRTNPGDSAFLDRRDGNPWELEFTTDEDESPDAARFCDESVLIDPKPHG